MRCGNAAAPVFSAACMRQPRRVAPQGVQHLLPVETRETAMSRNCGGPSCELFAMKFMVCGAQFPSNIEITHMSQDITEETCQLLLGERANAGAAASLISQPSLPFIPYHDKELRWVCNLKRIYIPARHDPLFVIRDHPRQRVSTDQMQGLLPPFESTSTHMYTAFATSVTQCALLCRRRHKGRLMQSAYAATHGAGFDNSSDGGLEAIDEQAEDEEDEETGNGMAAAEDAALLPYAQRS